MTEAAAQVFGLAEQRLMTLLRDPQSQIPEAIEILKGKSGTDLFPHAEAPEAAAAGLWLGVGDWERAHQMAQDIESPDGYYWHAMVHRQEPDAWNSKYWFDKVGRHPIYPELAAIGQKKLGLSGPWNAARFVDLCVEAAGNADEQSVRELQQAEWRLLLLHCSRSASR
jgi:hypothetical protein